MQAAEPIGFDSLYERVCDPELTQEARRDLFDALLKSPGGPFMDSHLPMRRSLNTLAQHITRSELTRMNLPVSRVHPDDVANNAIVVFLQDCHRIRDRKKLRSWFWSVMQKSVSKELGGIRAFVETSDLTLVDREQHLSIQPTDEASSHASSTPKAKALQDAIGELSPPLRQVAILHGLEGRTHEETAEVLGIAPTAVRVRWLRAKRQLQKRLAGHVRVPRLA